MSAVTTAWGGHRRAGRRTSYLPSVLHQLRNARSITVTDEREIVTGPEAFGRIQGVADALRACGVRPGAVVTSLCATNSVDSLVARYAVHAVGAAFLSLTSGNPAGDEPLTTPERAELIAGSGSEVLLVSRGGSSAVEALRESSDRLRVLPLPDAASRGPLALHDSAETELATVEFTSGTTGRPRPVRKSVGCYTRQVHHQLRVWRRPVPGGGALLAVTPITSTASTLVDAAIIRGERVVLRDAFDLDEVMAVMRSADISDVYLAVPHLLAVLDHPHAVQVAAHPALRQIVYSGTPIATRRVRQAREVFGTSINQLYGTTELGGLTTLSGADHERPALSGTVGLPFPWVQLQVRHPKTGSVVPQGKPGELWARTDTTMDGYGVGDQCSGVPADGWLPTGDLGRVEPSGRVRLHGRTGHVIKRGGIQFDPTVVERVLLEHNGVRQAIVRAAPDSERIEHVSAVVSVDRRERVAAVDLQELVRRRLGHDLVPELIEFWSGVPLDPSGRPDPQLISLASRRPS